MSGVSLMVGEIQSDAMGCVVVFVLFPWVAPVVIEIQPATACYKDILGGIPKHKNPEWGFCETTGATHGTKCGGFVFLFSVSY